MEKLSLKDALFLASKLVNVEHMDLAVPGTDLRKKRIKQLLEIAEDIQKEANRKIKND